MASFVIAPCVGRSVLGSVGCLANPGENSCGTCVRCCLKSSLNRENREMKCRGSVAAGDRPANLPAGIEESIAAVKAADGPMRLR